MSFTSPGSPAQEVGTPARINVHTSGFTLGRAALLLGIMRLIVSMISLSCSGAATGEAARADELYIAQTARIHNARRGAQSQPIGSVINAAAMLSASHSSTPIKPYRLIPTQSINAI